MGPQVQFSPAGSIQHYPLPTAASASVRHNCALENIKLLGFSCKTLTAAFHPREHQRDQSLSLSRTVSVNKCSEMLKMLQWGGGENLKILKYSATFSLRMSYSRSGGPWSGWSKMKIPTSSFGIIQADSALLYYEITCIIISDKKTSHICSKEKELDPMPYFHASLIYLSITS